MMNSLEQPWKRVKAWSGWTGVGVTACLLLVACLVLGLGQNRERFGDAEAKPLAAHAGQTPLTFTSDSGDMPSMGRKLPPKPLMMVSPTSLLASIAIEESKGRRYFRIRAVENGPELFIDAETGRLIEEAAVSMSSGGGGGGDGPHTPKGALSVVPALPMIPTLDIERN